MQETPDGHDTNNSTRKEFSEQFTERFAEIRDAMAAYDKAREVIIKRSRDALKGSKQAIYALHRGDFDEAKKLLDEARTVKEELEREHIAADPTLRTGGFSGACEEYVEGLAFLTFLERGELVARDECKVQPAEYLGGLADLTGELGRRAVLLATERKVDEVRAIRDFCDALYGQFVRFDFRNGDLRRKYDTMKYTLQKMERLLYELNLSRS